MTGLCRVCDSALLPDEEVFVRGTTTWAVFQVRCATCQSTYEVRRETPMKEDVHGLRR